MPTRSPGYDVVVNGTVEVIGGTSASAPSWQGIWARAQAAHGGTLGFAGPVLYALPAAAFHDITVGTNGLFPATPGWDYTTGSGDSRHRPARHQGLATHRGSARRATTAS